MPDSDRQARAFLGVEHSLKGRRWQERLTQAQGNIALAISQETGLPDIVGRVLAGRGVTAKGAQAWLAPSIRELMPDPSVMTAMDEAASRIADAVERRERIAIFGDYDVDGASSSALMARFLESQNVPHEIYIPDRIFEGYGPNPAAIRELAGRGARLIITVDCGSTSHKSLGEARALGCDAVVLDHHQTGTELPPALALVNPNREDDLSGLGNLCAAGVTFMALVAVQRELRRRGRQPGLDLLANLDLVALATVCDVVPLTGLNRAFVTQGLKVMRHQSNPGLAALSKAARLDGPVSPYHLGFLLGPRINAGGRIGDAALGSRLLATGDGYEAERIAAELDQLNAKRQEEERIMLEEAMAEAEGEMAGGTLPGVLVAARKGWHPGIVGLIASRLKEKYSIPAFAIAFDPSGKGSGSGRSIAGADIGRAVREAVEAGILAKGGGHAMAAGLTVMRDRLGDLRAFLEERLAKQVANARLGDVLRIDGALSARGATAELMETLERAGPWGAGNAEPVFAFPAHLVERSWPVGSDHVGLTLSSADGARLQAILFRDRGEAAGRALMDGQGRRFHVAGMLGFNHWQGRKRLQLRIADAAPAS